MKIKKEPMPLLIKQLDTMWGIESEEEEIIARANDATLKELAFCFEHISNKYYYDGTDTQFNPLHIGQWTMYLYKIAQLIKLENTGAADLCNKIYGLSKAFSSADIYYEVQLPSIWFFDHPQGAVIGRGKYSDYFFFSQGCTVGNNKGIYPTFGNHVAMMSNSKVLGNCQIGDHVIFAANTFVMDMNIPSHSLVTGQYPNNIIKSITEEKYWDVVKTFFR